MTPTARENGARGGRFVTVEGIEGAGKTTLIASLVERLEARGVRVVATREPGGTALGEALRTLLLDPRHAGLSDDAELLMVFAARAEHLHRVVRPALAEGHWVLCDRFTDATYAYQGGGRGLATELIEALERRVQRGLGPDRTLLLDLDPHLGLERARGRAAADRFERESIEFFTRVREAYLARAEDARFAVIDASLPPGEVLERAEAALEALL